MLDIGWPELLVVAIVLVVVVGPKDLPRMLRTFGQTTRKLRSMANDFRRQFDEALREAELDDVKNLANEARKLDPTAEIRKNFDPMRKAGEDIKKGLEGAMKSNPPLSQTGEKPVVAETKTSKSQSAGKPSSAKEGSAKAAPKKSGSAGKPTSAKKAPAAKKPARTAARKKSGASG